jgi:hypothetical protein
MMRRMKLTRKEFLTVGALAGATVTLLITGCGSDDDGGGSGGAGGGTGGSGGGTGGTGGGTGGAGGSSGSPCTADIVGNHGHVLDIPAADLDSTTPMAYDIQGTSVHNHTVVFTPTQLADLKAGNPVSVDSNVAAAHSHSVTVTCV